jgi:uncharacterized protein YxjI
MSEHQLANFDLTGYSHLIIHQRHEMGEWLGFETRNKYEILNQSQTPIGFAAEKQKGILGFLFRQFLGHWRRFEIQFYNLARDPIFTVKHPFRWFFQRLEVYDISGVFLGAIQQRFSVLNKRFDIQDVHGQVIMEVASPIWKIWSFPFLSKGIEVAKVQKKWSGFLSEVFTDRDSFHVGFNEGALTNEERTLVLAAALFIDLNYFENKAG